MSTALEPPLGSASSPSLTTFPPAEAFPSRPPSLDSVDVAPIRTSEDYRGDEDEESDANELYYVAPRQKLHKATPSTSHLLSSEQTSATTLSGERRLREYRLELEEAQEDAATTGWRRVLLGPKRFLKRNEGFLLIVMSQGFFSAINTMIKVLQDRVKIPVWEIIVIRMSVTWLGCYTYMKWAKIEHPLIGPPGVRLLLMARGVAGFFGLFAMYYSLKYLSLSDATVLSFLSPMLVGVLAALLLKESYSRLEALTSLLSLCGTVLIAKPTFLFGSHGAEPVGPDGFPSVTAAERTTAVFTALGGVLGSACAYLCIRVVGKKANALHSIAYFSAYASIVSSLYPFFFHAPFVIFFDRQFLVLILPIGVLGFIAQILLTTGLQREKAGRGSLAVYSLLLYSLVFERVVFHKYPDVWSILGSLIIMGGAVSVILEKERSRSQTKALRSTAADDPHKAEEGRESMESVDSVLPGIGGGGSGER